MHVQYIQGFCWRIKKRRMKRNDHEAPIAHTQNTPCASDKLNKTNALLPTTLVRKVGFHREMVERREKERKKETSYHQQISTSNSTIAVVASEQQRRHRVKKKFMHIRTTLSEKEVEKGKKWKKQTTETNSKCARVRQWQQEWQRKRDQEAHRHAHGLNNTDIAFSDVVCLCM